MLGVLISGNSCECLSDGFESHAEEAASAARSPSNSRWTKKQPGEGARPPEIVEELPEDTSVKEFTPQAKAAAVAESAADVDPPRVNDEAGDFPPPVDSPLGTKFLEVEVGSPVAAAHKFKAPGFVPAFPKTSKKLQEETMETGLPDTPPPTPEGGLPQRYSPSTAKADIVGDTDRAPSEAVATQCIAVLAALEVVQREISVLVGMMGGTHEPLRALGVQLEAAEKVVMEVCQGEPLDV